MTIDCRAIRELLVEYSAGRLPDGERDQVRAHLEQCPGCRRASADELETTRLLRSLPRHTPSRALRDGLLAAYVTAPEGAQPALPAATASAADSMSRTAWSRRVTGWLTPFLIGAVAAAGAVLVVGRAAPGFHDRPVPSADETSGLVDEAVNDHLRVVGSTHPIEIESGGIHQVKPWFTGRLEFAPRVAFSGDADFPLRGGSVGYFRDRKAALFHFSRRLHSITLLTFPANGLPWPAERLVRIGSITAAARSARGFSVLMWREEDFAYVLVSDAAIAELETLAVRINPPR